MKISMKKIMITSLLVLPALVAPAEAQNEFVTFLLEVVVFAPALILNTVNLVTGIFGLEPLTLPGLVLGILSLVGQGSLQDTLLDAVCSPIEGLVGDLGNCTCALKNAGAEDLDIQINCEGENYCLDGDSDCGDVSLDAVLTVRLAEALNAVVSSTDIGANVIPNICVELADNDEKICAGAKVSASFNLASMDLDNFTPTITEPYANIQIGEDAAVSCEDVETPCPDNLGAELSIYFDCSKVEGSILTEPVCIPKAS